MPLDLTSGAADQGMAMNWREAAARASAFMGETRRGGKEAALAEACSHLAKISKGSVKIGPPALRTYLLAARFLEEFTRRHRDPVLSDVMSRLPVAAIEVLARWYAYDPRGVIGVLRQAASNGAPSVRRLRDLERRAADRHSGPIAHGRRLKNDYRDHVLTEMETFRCRWPAEALPPRWQRRGEGDVEPATPQDPTGSSDFFGWVVEGDAVKSCAALIVGPYSRIEFYAPRAADWVLRGLGLLAYFDRVVLVLPPDAPAEKFIPLLAKARAADGLSLLADPGSG